MGQSASRKFHGGMTRTHTVDIPAVSASDDLGSRSVHHSQHNVLSAKYNTIQYNIVYFQHTAYVEHNNITPTIRSKQWDGWRGGGQKNNLIVVHT